MKARKTLPSDPWERAMVENNDRLRAALRIYFWCLVGLHAWENIPGMEARYWRCANCPRVDYS